MPKRPEIQYRLSTGRMPRLRAADAGSQWEATEHFLRTCTDGLQRRIKPGLNLAFKPGDGSIMQSAVDRAEQLFGPVLPHHDSFGYAQYSWELRGSQLPAAVHFLSEGEPWVQPGSASVALTFLAFFRWRDPHTGSIFPYQPDPSRRASGTDCTQLYVSLGPSGHVQPQFRLPFTQVGASFLRFLKHLGRTAPFRLAPSHFTVAIPHRGDTYRRRALTPKERALVKNTLAP